MSHGLDSHLQTGLVPIGVVPEDFLMVYSALDTFAGFRGTPLGVQGELTESIARTAPSARRKVHQ
jgi:hypothetical protein